MQTALSLGSVRVSPPRLHLEPAPDAPLTLLRLIWDFQEEGLSDLEVVSTVSGLIDSGWVRLIGNFRGEHLRGAG